MLTYHVILLLIFVGFAAGYIDSIAGGGGLLTIPVLLSVGFPPHIALGTNKLAASLGAVNASIIYIRKKVFQWQFWRAALVFCFIGATVGTIAVHYIPAHMLDKIIPAIILCVAIYTVLPKRKTRFRKDSTNYQPKKLSSSSLGFSLGFYDGFFGPGTGTIWTTILMAYYKLNLLQCCGITRIMNAVSNIVSLFVFMYFGSVDYYAGLIMGGGLFIGSFFGAHSAIRFGTGFIRPIYIGIVLILTVEVVLKNWM